MTNCPNCGAVISDVVCPYCGTVFYDFCNVSMNRPTYLRIKVNDSPVACRAALRDMTYYVRPGEFPEIDFSFTILPDDKGVFLRSYKNKGGEE